MDLMAQDNGDPTPCVDWTWYDAQTGGNQIFSGQTYTPIVTAPGTYQYYVSCTDVDLCESERTVCTYIIVETPPAPDDIVLEICQDDDLPGFVQPVGSNAANSVFNSYSSTGIPGAPLTPIEMGVTGFTLSNGSYNPPMDNATPGVYTILYTEIVSTPLPDGGTLECESSPATITLTVLARPALPAPTNSGPVCEGESIELTVGAEDNATYAWTEGPGGTLVSTAPMWTLTTPVDGTIYCVVVTNEFGCVSDEGCTTITVLTEEMEPGTLDYSICQGDTAPAGEGLMLDPVDMCGTDIDAQWYTSPGGTQIGAGNTFLPSGYTSLAPGAYTYYVTCGAGAACVSGFSTAILTILPQPEPPVVPDVTVCEGVSIDICFSIITDPDVTGIMVSPPNSSSTGSMLAVDGSGCVSIDPADPGYVGGDYTVTYEDANGCESLPGTGTITINPKPADPAVNSECVCAGEDAVLTVTNPVAGGSYSWTGPAPGNTFVANGTTATIPGVVFGNHGEVYNVILTDGSGCTSMGNGAICVRELPTVSTPVNDEICEGDTPSMGLSATCSNTLLWYDSFVGGNQVGANQNFIPPGASSLSPGVYTYYAECSEGDCASERIAATLTVTPAPPAPTLPNITVCDSVDIVICASIFGSDNDGFTGTVFPPNSNSMSSALTPDLMTGCVTIPFGDADYVSGIYTAVYIENGCTSLVGQGEITINPSPQEPVVKTACVCDGEDVQFTISNPLQGGSYSWTGPNGYTSNNPAPTITGLTEEDDNGTTYGVIVVDANGCSAMGQGTVCISPVPTVTIVEGSNTICEGSTPSDFVASCSDDPDPLDNVEPIVLWYDSFVGGALLGSGNSFIPSGASNLSAGTYTYYAACSIGDCEGTRKAVTLTVISSAEPSALPDIVVCDGEDVVICPSVFDDTGIMMGMIFPPGSTSMSSALTVVNGCGTIPPDSTNHYVNGIYTVQYLDAGGCTVTGEGTITINPSPVVPVVETACVCDGEDVQFTITNPLAGGSYEWTGPNGYMSNNPNPTITDLSIANGDNEAPDNLYTVIVTDANGCTSMGQGTVCILPAPTDDLMV